MSAAFRWTFRTIPPELADTSRWRKVDAESLDDSSKARFLVLKSAIDIYLETGRLSAVCKDAGVPPTLVLRQLNRCVSNGEDGQMLGWTALIEHTRAKPYVRQMQLPQGNAGACSGFTGAFRTFLAEHENIKTALEDLILKRRGKLHEARITIKTLHATFVGMCESAGIRSNQYPLNSKSQGLRSLARFAKEVLQRNLVDGAAARYGKNALKRLGTGTGYGQHLYAFAPYDLAGLDAHKLHCYGTIKILGPAGPQRVAIERLWIVPVLEYQSRAILGYSVGIRTECNAAVIENALISAMSVWQPRQLTVPGMTYRPGAGLPSGIFPELAGRGWVTLMLDNAAVHFSRAVAERARRRIGCFLNFGPVGRWEHRAALERLMKTLEVYGFQRLPSSTGSSPQDPARDDPVRKAVELGIDWEHLLDLIDIVIANYNVTPHTALGNRTPLGVLRDNIHDTTLDFLPRSLPPPTCSQPELGITVETRFVRGNREAGRRPYVEIDRVHYTNPVLANAMGMIGKKLRLHVRESNLCTVTAYLESGEEIGVLTAQGAWGRVPHTREMRKQINALIDARELANVPGDDPVQKLLSYYAAQVVKQTSKNRFKVSRAATKLAHVAHAAGCSPDTVSVATTPPIEAVEPPDKLPSQLIKPPRWKSINS